MASFDNVRLYNCMTEYRKPDWTEYLRLTLCGVSEDSRGQCTSCQTVDNADYFTVYGVLHTGESDAITDTPPEASLEEALAIARELETLSGLPLEICDFLPGARA